jgi:hypothetical protein
MKEVFPINTGIFQTGYSTSSCSRAAFFSAGYIYSQNALLKITCAKIMCFFEFFNRHCSTKNYENFPDLFYMIQVGRQKYKRI